MKTIAQMADAVLCRVLERMQYRNEYSITTPSIHELVETELNILFEKMTDSEASSIAAGITDYATIKISKLKPKDFQGDLLDYIRNKKDEHKGKISIIDDLEFFIWGFIWLCAAAVLADNTPTPQPQQLPQPDQTTTDAGKPQQYTFDTVKIKAVYEFCIETNVISDSISVVDFMCAVSNADFKPIYKTAKLKGKCRYIIYVLSSRINNPMSSEWYRNTAHSIDTEPNKCSGANVPYEWKRDANALK